MSKVLLDGSPVATNGELPAVGSKAPDFRLVGSDMGDVSLASFAGKRKIISILLSLETPVCQASIRRFNESAAALGDTVVLNVSVDAPFSHRRFCEATGIEGVHLLSLLRGKKFAKDYGVLLVDGPCEGATCRAVVVTDENDIILHTELCPEIGQEPDYDAIFAALG